MQPTLLNIFYVPGTMLDSFHLVIICFTHNYKAGAVSTSILQLRNLKIREVKKLVQSHIDSTCDAKRKIQVILTPNCIVENIIFKDFCFLLMSFSYGIMWIMFLNF